MRSFKKRLLSLIVLLVVVAQGVTVVLAYVSLRQNVSQQSAAALQEARSQIDRRLDAQDRQLRVAAELVVRDYGFQSVVTGDAPTIVSNLRSQLRRSDADVALLYSSEGMLRAATQDVAEGDVPAPPQDDESGTRNSSYAVIHGRPYQLVFTPVTVPQPVGWVALGLVLDDQLAGELRKVVNAEVSIVATDAERTTIASTLPGEGIRGLLAARSMDSFDQPREADVQGESFLTLGAALPASGGRIELLVQRSLNLALAPLRRMSVDLLLICGAILLAALAAGMAAGNSALRPLGMLVEMARQIARGNYRQRVEFRGDEEFQQLASTFNTMQTAIEQREAHIFVQATQDSLTGFANRKAFRQLLGEMMATAPPPEHLTVALLDVLRFRDINASVGYPMGDQLLRELARRIQTLVGSAAGCARVNADTYAIVMPLPDVEVQQRIAALAGEWRRGVVVDSLVLNVEIRCGIAEWRNGVTAEDLLRQAGVALVEAKGRTSGSVLYQPGHDAELNRRVTLVAELRRAIVNDTLTLSYQPLLAISNREPLMLEALVRWSHPTLGDISPGEFVPLAERAAVIADLSRWVLTAAIRQMGQWRRIGLDIHVAVNLSAADLVDPMLPLRVLTLLQEHDVQPTQLLLEVTESTIMREPALAAQFMERLRTSGLRFGIDDFGTGYSSLASLHSLPVDELKLDRAFIHNLDRNTTNQAIVRAVITLAHTMNLKVVAEGVETPEVWNQLGQLGCDLAQGYYISRPMGADVVPAWLRTQRALVIPAAADPSGVVAPFRARSAERPAG